MTNNAYLDRGCRVRVKAGSKIDAKALRCVVLNFASGENIEFVQNFLI